MVKMPSVDYQVVEIKGGWNSDTPTLSLPAGVFRDCLNFEMSPSLGTSRIGGYERSDGRAKPSDATFTLVQVASYTNTPVVGQTLSGTSGGAHSGVLIVVGSDKLMVITKVSGTFVVGETVTVGATTIGVVVERSVSITPLLRAQYLNLAADNYRADIGAVPGSGTVRGVAVFNDIVYAFRDNAGATACAMYKQTSSGWAQVLFEHEVNFTNANASVGDGDTLTQGGVTATIRRVMVQSGTLASGVNTGRLVISAPSGGNFSGTVSTATVTISNASPGVVTWTAHGLANGTISIFTTTGALPTGLTVDTPYYITSTGANTFTASLTASGAAINTTSVGSGTHTATASNATSTSGGVLTLSAIQTAITMAVGGKFQFDKANFFGQASGLRLYGCDGANRMFEFDGNYFCPISTGNSPDKPKYLGVLKNHLFAGIGSSAFHSGPGTPYIWTAVAGASEIATGDTITGFKVLVGSTTASAMMIGGINNTFVLYGTSAADWNFVTYVQGSGVLPYSIESLAENYFFNSKGLVELKATQSYGNFEQSSLTNDIKAFVRQKKLRIAHSSISRERSQYRIFFTDGYGLYVTIVNGKSLGATQVLFNDAASCAYAGELATGQEVLFFGAATGGYVYQLDKGSSFDGAEINARLVLNYNHAKSPRTLKRYRKASIEMQGTAYVALRFGYSFAYSSTYEIRQASTDHTLNISGSASWDSSVTWDQAGVYWDGKSTEPVEVDMTGVGENIQMTITSGTDYLYPFSINSVILHYTKRRGLR